jgi:hypothetical protein
MNVTFDAKAVLARVGTLTKKVSPAAMKATEDAANELLRLSQFEVPHDTGFLQNTGTVQQRGTDFITGYNTRYAARLHEHPEYRFQKGRKGKYLEDPLVRNLRALGLRWSKNVKSNLF